MGGLADVIQDHPFYQLMEEAKANGGKSNVKTPTYTPPNMPQTIQAPSGANQPQNYVQAPSSFQSANLGDGLTLALNSLLGSGFGFASGGSVDDDTQKRIQRVIALARDVAGSK